MQTGSPTSPHETSSREGLRLGVTKAKTGDATDIAITSIYVNKRSSRRSRTTSPNLKQKILALLNNQSQKPPKHAKFRSLHIHHPDRGSKYMSRTAALSTPPPTSPHPVNSQMYSHRDFDATEICLTIGLDGKLHLSSISNQGKGEKPKPYDTARNPPAALPCIHNHTYHLSHQTIPKRYT